MVKVRVCSFCGSTIQPGQGITYVKNDGTVMNFCSKKCRVFRIEYKKNPRKIRWTKFYGQK